MLLAPEPVLPTIYLGAKSGLGWCRLCSSSLAVLMGCTKSGPAAAGISVRCLCHKDHRHISVDRCISTSEKYCIFSWFSLSQFCSYGFSREGLVSSWQTKASCHVSIVFCLFTLSWIRGALLGHCMAPAACSGSLCSEQIATELDFASCPVVILWFLVLYNGAQHFLHKLQCCCSNWSWESCLVCTVQK